MKKRALKRILTGFLAAIMVVSILANSYTVYAANPPSVWAQEAVAEAINAGLVPVHLQSNFTAATTRAEFAALAVALYENRHGTITGRITFDDTADISVAKAAYVGLVNGVGNNMFNPNGTLTREQAAVLTSRLADALNHPLPRVPSTFADNANISYWALESVGHVQAAQIMGGVGNNIFDPRGSYTREQSIVTIMRLYNIIPVTELELPVNWPEEGGTAPPPIINGETVGNSAFIGTWSWVDIPTWRFVFNANGTGTWATAEYESANIEWMLTGGALHIITHYDSDESLEIWNFVITDGISLRLQSTTTGEVIYLVYGAIDLIPGEAYSALVGNWIWDSNPNWVYTFNADGTGTRGFPHSLEEFTWEVYGDELRTTTIIMIQLWAFEIDGDTLRLETLQVDGISYIYTRY